MEYGIKNEKAIKDSPENKYSFKCRFVIVEIKVELFVFNFSFKLKSLS